MRGEIEGGSEGGLGLGGGSERGDWGRKGEGYWRRVLGEGVRGGVALGE